MTKGGPGTDGRLSSKRSAYACHAVYAVSFAAAQADHMQYGVTQHDVYFMSLGALCMSPWRTAPRRQPGRSGTWCSWSAGHAWQRRWRPLLQPGAGTPPSALTSYSVHQATLPVNIKVVFFDFATLPMNVKVMLCDFANRSGVTTCHCIFQPNSR